MSDFMTCLIAITIYFAAVTICGVIAWLRMKHEEARKAASACRAFNAKAARPSLALARMSR